MIKKDYKLKDKKSIIDEITNAYDNMLSRHNKNQTSLIKIDLTNTNSKEEKEYNFKLRVMLDKLRKSYLSKTLNYLYVIEIGEQISKGNDLITNEINYHSHIILETNISIEDIIKSIKKHFHSTETFSLLQNQNSDCYIENISDRSDKGNYIFYLLKQPILSNYSYNFKIS